MVTLQTQYGGAAYLTADRTLKAGDARVLVCTNGITITLPASVRNKGLRFVIINAGASVVHVPASVGPSALINPGQVGFVIFGSRGGVPCGDGNAWFMSVRNHSEVRPFTVPSERVAPLGCVSPTPTPTPTPAACDGLLAAGGYADFTISGLTSGGCVVAYGNHYYIDPTPLNTAFRIGPMVASSGTVEGTSTLKATGANSGVFNNGSCFGAPLYPLSSVEMTVRWDGLTGDVTIRAVGAAPILPMIGYWRIDCVAGAITAGANLATPPGPLSGAYIDGDSGSCSGGTISSITIG